MGNSLGIRAFDYVEFYVGSAKQVAYWHARALGFKILGYLGPETGHRDRCTYYLRQNDIKIQITSALQPGTYDVTDFVTRHGDGVKKIGYEVDDVEAAFARVVECGGIPVQQPQKYEDESGYVIQGSFRVYDDTEIVLINYDHYKGILKPGFGPPVQKFNIECEDPNLCRIDHIVGNVRPNEMNMWAGYFNKIFNFETFVDFGPGDIATKYSALLSKVVRSSDNVIKHPINEPYKGLRKSQIQEFIEEYHGSGVQHIAIHTDSILNAIPALRKNGVEFLQVPSTYYDELRRRGLKINQNIDDLEREGILCDFEGEGYLLQLFTKPIGDRPTFFYEIIQRVGKSEGFGKGNFQSLFEAIELDQAKRGNL